MAGSVHQLILAAVFAQLAASAMAEPVAPMKPEKQRRKDVEATPEFENVRKALDALTPEQRKRFQENFWRWANLPPEEKKALRDRDEVRKKFMQQEVQAALQETGLTLEGERRDQFIKRYGEERRKLEEQLRKEIMEKRKPMVREIISKLKEEFSTPDAAASVIAPAAEKQ